LAASRRLGLTESPGLLYAVARMSVCIPAGCACRALLCIYLHSLMLSVLCSRYRLPAPVATVHVLAGSCSLGRYAWAPKGQVGMHGQSAGGAQPDLIDACKRWFCWKQTLWGPWQAAACLAGGRRRRARAARPVAAVCFSCARGSAPAPTCYCVAVAEASSVVLSVGCSCCALTVQGHVHCMPGASMLQHLGLGGFGFCLPTQG
jgi:hypothetical protein